MLWAVLAASALAACGETAAPTGVATNPPGGSTVTESPSPGAASGVRTVLSPLGLNLHSDPAVTAPKIGTAAQGVVLTVVDHTDQNGGWYKVHGQTLTGWITGDPSLTAAGQFTSYSSSTRGFNALYPQSWTFAEDPTAVTFHPQNGPQSIVVRSAATTAAFGAAGGPGFSGSGQQDVVVCGYTGSLLQFSRGTSTATSAPASASTSASPAASQQPLLAQVRLRLDATHALSLDFGYSAAADLDVFNAFYNSMTFPFPQCQQTATPSPSP